ncbi:MAG: adaptor protein MecA [Clostridia bacterium]|nr:adaptor protein MecA [Clostridia bacterium]
MKFEKLNEDKIRITLSSKDLVEKDIDFHSFMSNSIKSQDLFLDILEEAEKKVGFVTKDYKVRIEALAMNDGNFIFTVTRFSRKQRKGFS